MKTRRCQLFGEVLESRLLLSADLGEQRVMTADGAQSVYATGLVDDGDMDVLSASALGDEITWCENKGRLAGDVDENGEVAFADFLKLSGNFGTFDAVWEDGDLDGSGKVEFADFLILSANYGATNPIETIKSECLVRVVDFGAVGDGITDDTAAIQAAFNAAVDGGTIVFYPREYVLSSTVTVTDKRLTILGNGATLIGTAPTGGSMLLLDAVDGSRIDNLNGEGATLETSSSFEQLSGNTLPASFLRVQKSTNISITGMHISGHTVGVYLETVSDSIIDSVTIDGFLAAPHENARFAAGVSMKGGQRNRLTNISAHNHGSVVLVGTRDVPYGHVIDSCSGNALYDNGIYISSGIDITVSRCQLDGVHGSGIKARGSTHVVVGNKIMNSRVGVTATGMGRSALDDAMHTGYGTLVMRNDIQNTIHGIRVDTAFEAFARRFLVISNVITNTRISGIWIRGGHQHEVNSNVLNLGRSFYGILAGWHGAQTSELSVEDNKVTAATYAGIMAVENSKLRVISNSLYEMESSAIRHENTESAVFPGNRLDDELLDVPAVSTFSISEHSIINAPSSATAAADGVVEFSAATGNEISVSDRVGTTFNVAVSGMTGDGTVTATVAAGGVMDAAGNPNAASISTENTIMFDATPPAVTIDRAVGQPDLTNASPINYIVVFSEAVTDFTEADVTLGGTAGATTVVVTGSGTTYNVAVSGMTSDGAVTADVAVGGAMDAAGNPNVASTSTDNTVKFDAKISVTVDQAVSQTDPTNASPIDYTVVFSEAVGDFATGDVTLSGTAGATTAVVTGSGTTYNVAVSGMTNDGTVIATIPAGVATNASGTPNSASSSADDTITYDNTAPTVTIDQAARQADPTSASTIHYTVVFREPVTGFTEADVMLGGTAGATTAVVTGTSETTYNVAVSGMTRDGTVTARIVAGGAVDATGNPNIASISKDNTVTFDGTAFTVAIELAVGQAHPTNAFPINYTVVFSDAVSDFATGDVTLSGTAGATTAVVTGSGTTYNVAVSGMTNDGTVIATIPAGVATNASSTPNNDSMSTKNKVTFDTTSPSVTIEQASGQVDPTNAFPIYYTVVFSEPVTGFTEDDVTLGGTAGATTAVVNGRGTTYNVAVSGMTSDGTVSATVVAGGAADAGGNPNAASTSTDNIVTFDAVPTVTIDWAIGQADSTNVSPINYTVVFSEPVTGFTEADVTLGGTAGATTAVVTGSGTTYSVAVTGMSGDGTVITTVVAGGAIGASGEPNAASTSTNNIVTFDGTGPTVTVEQAAGQVDATNAPLINYTVVFSEAVTDFTAADVTLGGTTGATTALVTAKDLLIRVVLTARGGSLQLPNAVEAQVLVDGETEKVIVGWPDEIIATLKGLTFWIDTNSLEPPMLVVAVTPNLEHAPAVDHYEVDAVTVVINDTVTP